MKYQIRPDGSDTVFEVDFPIELEVHQTLIVVKVIPEPKPPVKKTRFSILE